MISAWVYKEFQEARSVALLGGIALAAVTLAQVNFNPLPMVIPVQQQGRIPFAADSFTFQFGMVALSMAGVLGFVQSLWDFRGDAQLFLLHRPLSRSRIYAAKLLVGMALYLVCSLGAVATYAVWAAWPGTHASPFAWSMTWTAWCTAFSMTAVYLGAFLSGIRPAAWFGTRLAPLVASCIAPTAAQIVNWPAAMLIILIADVALAIAILQVANTRDFD